MDDAVSVSRARVDLSLLVDRAEAGEPTVITRRGVPVAAIVPMGEYDALERAVDAELGRQALRELAEEGPRASWAEVLGDVVNGAE
ncbi:type II toxin-antitoxin system Phd/YefM family antitoxin [Streptomyces sp. S6]